MIFYLGTHVTNWLRKTDVPLCVSRRRLTEVKNLPTALGPWILDSGGFTELSMFGKWTVSPRQYVEEVQRFSAIGNLTWAAPQDWMCEPWIVAKTGLTVEEHQRRTVENFLELRYLDPSLPFVPVMQGWTLQDYEHHLKMYDAAGVDLTSEPFVGLGSVCRRQQTQGGREVALMLNEAGINVHAFGLKLTGLQEIGYLLQSSDSMAWSYGARRSPPLAGCSHKSCANCLLYALKWREKVLKKLEFQQPHLTFV